jgi:DNA-binding PadR family transcriptional regulator
MAPVPKFEGCRRRCSDLRAAGFIEDTGDEDEGRIVWAITAQGNLAFAKMRRDGFTR